MPEDAVYLFSIATAYTVYALIQTYSSHRFQDFIFKAVTGKHGN